MGAADVIPVELRVERGQADDDELAAVAVVLCSVLAAGRTAASRLKAPPADGAPSWRCPERADARWRSPHSWR
ncbi:acyl-CoA carboxylase subunit epsilon [Streptomyces lusitanus]|uniref:Acyl-CoA carboxylase subunit epsilon n=1 Tax=Streptomyces lusitanus TaxID=68232 RepID=A0ABU3K2F4_9ACTN|nr:acyl-CoA carboxylase subunit epsilon [Streptomyces lusitanus]